MVDFSSLLKKPAGEAKKPEALPATNYPGVIKSYEFGDQNKNKTPYLRVQVVPTGWPEDIDPVEDVDLSKRTMRRDFYLTEDAFWRLDEFLRALGIEPGGRSYEDCIPEIIGAQVVIEVQQYVNQNTMEVGNQVGRLTAAD